MQAKITTLAMYPDAVRDVPGCSTSLAHWRQILAIEPSYENEPVALVPVDCELDLASGVYRADYSTAVFEKQPAIGSSCP